MALAKEFQKAYAAYSNEVNPDRRAESFGK